MNETREGLERQLAELRAQVAGLRRTVVWGFIALGGVVFVGLCAPGLGILVLGLAVLLVTIVTIAAALGAWTGKAVGRLRPDQQRLDPRESAPPQS